MANRQSGRATPRSPVKADGLSGVQRTTHGVRPEAVVADSPALKHRHGRRHGLPGMSPAGMPQRPAHAVANGLSQPHADTTHGPLGKDPTGRTPASPVRRGRQRSASSAERLNGTGVSFAYADWCHQLGTLVRKCCFIKHAYSNSYGDIAVTGGNWPHSKLARLLIL